MAVDLKLDIIYYNTPTDFEMEFNLSVCCTVRMLTSKSDSQKQFLTDLSKGVSRSRVIMCLGDISKSDGMLSIASSAVGLKLCSYDCDAYSVSDQDSRSILLPEGALPLVTEDGILGGCLIESGPQIIIFLTDDKDIRKRILKELVLEYLSALSGGSYHSANTNKVSTPEDEPSIPEDEPSDTDDQTDDLSEQTLDDTATSEQQNDVCEDRDEDNGDDDYSEDEVDDDYSEDEVDDYVEDPSQDDSDDEYVDEPTPKRKAKFLGLKITIGILCATLALIVGALVYYYFF